MNQTETCDLDQRDGENRPPARREVLGKFASAVFAGLVAPAILGKTVTDAVATPSDLPVFPPLPELPAKRENEDLLLRMMRDLRRALDKPVAERQWVMVIDLRKCVGCHACTIACNAENHLPPGVVYRPVIEEEMGTFPNVGQRSIPRPCMQCQKPPCVPVCPVGATFQRDDGIVEIDYDACIGCRYCITACPYNARTFDFGEFYTKGMGFSGLAPYETEPNHEYNVERDRANDSSPVGNARKCHFCLHRIEKGLLPQCVTTCMGRATYFGDANDKDSLVSDLIGSPNVMRLKEELGTEPSVYYLN
jgi:Fe-S-cluster-containing dehydrogenase component